MALYGEAGDLPGQAYAANHLGSYRTLTGTTRPPPPASGWRWPAAPATASPRQPPCRPGPGAAADRGLSAGAKAPGGVGGRPVSERPQPAANAGGPVLARLSSKKPGSASSTRTASQARNAASPVGAGEKTGPDSPCSDSSSSTSAGLSGCGPHALRAASSESEIAASQDSSSAATANS